MRQVKLVAFWCLLMGLVSHCTRGLDGARCPCMAGWICCPDDTCRHDVVECAPLDTGRHDQDAGSDVLLADAARELSSIATTEQSSDAWPSVPQAIGDADPDAIGDSGPCTEDGAGRCACDAAGDRSTCERRTIAIVALDEDCSLKRMHLSGDGRVVAYECRYAGSTEQAVYRWTVGSAPEKLTSLGSVHAISDNGRLLVGVDGSGAGVRWDADTGTLSPLDPILIPDSVSADGFVIVGRMTFGGFFRLAGGVLDAIMTDDKTGTVRVSGDGRVVVGSRHQTFFRWTLEEGLYEFPAPDPMTCTLALVNFDASVIVASCSTPSSGTDVSLWWDPSTKQWISKGNIAGASGLNDHGTVVVGTEGAPNYRARLWAGEGIAKDIHAILDDHGIARQGLVLTRGYGLSRDGKVVAGGAVAEERIQSGGMTHLWVARLP